MDAHRVFTARGDRPTLPVRWTISILWTLVGLSVVMVTLEVWRHQAALDQRGPWPLFAQTDFRDTVIGPVRDLLHGDNPYDVIGYTRRHPAQQEFSLYSPATLLLFMPVAVLPQLLAGLVWLWAQVAMLGWLCRRATSGIRAGWVTPLVLLVVIWRPPGLLLLSSGQVGTLTAFGCILSLCAPATWLRVFGVALACLKPQVGLPLLFVLAALRQWRTLLWGLGLTGVLALPVTAVLAHREHGPANLVRVVLRNATDVAGGTATGIGSSSSRPVDVLEVVEYLVPGRAGTLVGGVAWVALAALLGLALRRLRSTGRSPADPRLLLLAGGAIIVLAPNEIYGLAVLIPGLVPVLVSGFRQRDRSAFFVVFLLAVLVLLRPEGIDRLVGLPEGFSHIAAGMATVVLVTASGLALVRPGPAVPRVWGRHVGLSETDTT